MTARPRRQKLGDRLLSPDARAEHVAIDHAIAPFDRIAREMELRWGIDRLPSLVSATMAAKYGKAIAFLNDAISANDVDRCIAAAENCAKGLRAMDAEATAAGHRPNEGCYLEGEYEGFKFAIMEDKSQWPAAQKERPDLTFVTTREVGIALKAYFDRVPLAEVKAAFPKAEITALPSSNLPPGFFDEGGDNLEWAFRQ